MEIKNVSNMTKDQLCSYVMENVQDFCKLNNFSVPNIVFMSSQERTASSKFGVPSYYRRDNVYIEIKKMFKLRNEWSFVEFS